MRMVLRNATIHNKNDVFFADIAVENGVIADLFPGVSPKQSDVVADCGGLDLFPGFADVHVHLREPGFSYKETIATGTAAAAHGGYTAVCPMPNLSPVPDSAEHLAQQLRLIERDAVVRVVPYGAITRGEGGGQLADLAALAPAVCGFSDDGRGVQDADVMRAAMRAAKALGRPIVAHCEDNSLLRGGVIHDGGYARAHGLPGICSESEWRQVARDIALAQETGCAYHVCHVSAKESVALIRRAKADGMDITAETAPHYLLLDDSMLRDDGAWKMNPPLRDKSDRDALVAAVQDGTLDLIATDHAPHAASEKAGGLRDSLNGIVGLETAFPALYTGLVKPGLLPLPRLLELLCHAPRARFGLCCGEIAPGAPADFCLWDLAARDHVDPQRFCSLGHSTPFAGNELYGRCMLTLCGGKTVWQSPLFQMNR